ncbi:uncharacterized protein Z519_01835 [Cladophialophora bantiana CBS 173.52]|uniref:Cyclase n=1 Tax=Cladophialophora bantiana (strain ATCC 10958 / CBS 173.52 / CDC B-1940 / NIH 8579) TaxID=1442370 RepID=A0A0D2F838_CLAB1|nr:uncharacterized protein Z519_01835 [Cladophialophora bantiana CBS 173.52]KIW98251.1 hypothetical protein Z519_01835 [Cladophialophora bantiana CBS 173.52]
MQDWDAEDNAQALPTLNHWHERGGLIGRGVLIDFNAYADAKGIAFDPYSRHKITITGIEEVARSQAVTFKQGDIFILHTGYTEELESSSAERQEDLSSHQTWAGMESIKEAARWFWDKGFAAVASDNIGFEAEVADGNPPCEPLPLLYPYFLSLFGMCIGELWDLKALSKHCARTKRYSFLLASIPLNVPGAVGFPPNVLAIF